MSQRAVRRIVIAVCIAGIGGMIAGSVADNNGAALTAGMVTAVAVLCLIVATAVAHPAPGRTEREVEELGARVETGIGALVEAGADEAALRSLVGDAVRLGRAQRT